MVHRHEDRVDDDAHRDEEVDERVHDEQLHGVREAVPARRTLPLVDQLRALALHVVLPRQLLVEVQETWTRRAATSSRVTVVKTLIS